MTLSEQFEGYLGSLEYPSEPHKLYAPIAYSLRQEGKRLRPMLVLSACEAFGGDARKALPAAAAVEVFHNFTLLHDDIMDHADVRRGEPSVYAKWGQNVAILSGDAMTISAYEQLAKLPPDVLPRVLARFNRMALDVCEGQQYDMDFESRTEVSMGEYMQMISLKTAALLCGSLAIGAIVGGATDDQIEPLERFGMTLGQAFQIQDDLLDSYGTPALGKKIGGDILEGKKTWLAITAASLATPDEQRILRQNEIPSTRSIYDKHSVAALAAAQIHTLFSTACDAIPDSRFVSLRDYAASLIGREK